ncbi:MAG: IclR family transcriptional regulator [Bryobacteraceae bacterium]
MEKGVVTPRRRRPKNGPSDKRTPPADPYLSKAIGRALDVLERFTDERTTLSLKEISNGMDLPESSLFRILLTLESRGYLHQNADGSYRLTPRLLYGKMHEHAEQIRQAAHPYLHSLATRFDETASISYLFDHCIQVLDTVEALHQMRFTNRPGRVLPPHCSSMGKSITAFQSQERIDRIMEGYGLIRRTPRTIADRATLFQEFEIIRQRGYAVDREEATEGGFCIGAPIVIPGRPVISAVSLSMPVVRVNPELEPIMAAAVVKTAKAIAVALGR